MSQPGTQPLCGVEIASSTPGQIERLTDGYPAEHVRLRPLEPDEYDYLNRSLTAGLRNAHGVHEPPEAVHWDSSFDRQAGLPEPYDYGPERRAWLAVLLTNWMGPAGFLCRLCVGIRQFNVVGDLTDYDGIIKSRAGAGPRPGMTVALDVWADNQPSGRAATSMAEVEIPANRTRQTV